MQHKSRRVGDTNWPSTWSCLHLLEPATKLQNNYTTVGGHTRL